jgi:ATP-dependent DNA helicase DinG
MLNAGTAATRRPLTQIRERAHAFFEAFAQREGRFPFERQERASFLERSREAYDGLLTALKRLETEFAALSSKPEEAMNLARRAAEFRRELSFLLESDEKAYVYWFERRGKGIFLVATPIDVSEIMRERLFEQFDTIVLTSATLAVGGRFAYAKSRLGISAAQEKVLPQEFDYASQALLYIPKTLPDVRDARFAERAAEEIAHILEMTRGRAFCLFTSYAQMREIHERLTGLVAFPLLLQGTAPRSALLERFRATPGAVLLATASFWQGVDVPGSQLSCVIIDRLPFAVPSDPIVAARVRALQDDGQNAFGEFQVPKAVLALKQGFGRLIRSRTDRGVLAILDNRIQRMQYGRLFLESLPEYALTQDLAEVARFAEKL